MSCLPVLPVVSIFRLKKPGGDTLNLRLLHFNDWTIYTNYFGKKHVLSDGVWVTRCPHPFLMVTASLRPIRGLCVSPVPPATSSSTCEMSVFNTCQPETTSQSHSAWLVRFIEHLYFLYIILKILWATLPVSFIFLYLKKPKEERCQYPSHNMWRIVSSLCARMQRSMSDALYVTKCWYLIGQLRLTLSEYIVIYSVCLPILYH